MHRRHLSKDKKLGKILSTQDAYVLTKQRHIHLHLCASIMSQQLSTKVAAVIHGRFLNLFNTKNPSPAEILSIPFDDLKAIGLSNSKTHYVRNVCEFFIENKITDKMLHAMGDDEVKNLLISIKGVGKWTAEMLLMFALGREDIFAPDDLGIQQAMIRVYDLDPADRKKLREDMLRISEKWVPYRTYACLYLWKWKDLQ